MYDRAGMQALPYPFHDLPAPEASLTTLEFLLAMTTLLDNLHGLAATAYAGSLSEELAYQELTQALFVLKEYAEAAVMLFARWHRTVHPGPRVQEETHP